MTNIVFLQTSFTQMASSHEDIVRCYFKVYKGFIFFLQKKKKKKKKIKEKKEKTIRIRYMGPIVLESI